MTRRSQCFRIAVRQFPPFEQAIRAQWAAFEAHAHTGLTLDLVPLDLHALEHALFTSGGMAAGDWDVAFVATDWVAAMHQQRCALDLSAFLTANPPPDWPQGWPPSLLRLQSIEGTILGVPYHDGPECLIFRRDLFDDADNRRRFQQQHGRDLVPPRTWPEFHQVASFFTDPAIPLHGTAFAAFPDGHNTVYDFLLQLWTRGGDLFTANGSLRFNSPEAQAALSFYRSIINDRSATPPVCSSLDSVALGSAFAAGHLAMMVNWFGFAAFAHTSTDSHVQGLVDIAPIPCNPPGQSVSLNVYWLLSIASGSPHPETAWSFLRHTLTPPMDRLTTLSGAIGCRRSTWSDPEVNAAIPFYNGMEQLHAVAREIPTRADWPRIAAAIDQLVTLTTTTDTPIAILLTQAQAAADAS